MTAEIVSAFRQVRKITPASGATADIAAYRTLEKANGTVGLH